MAQNGTAWPQMTLKHFPWVYYMIICHVGPTWTLFRGPRGPHNGPKQHPKLPFMTKNGPSWPKMSLYEPKWQHLVRSSFYHSGAGWKLVGKKHIFFLSKNARWFFLFLATTYHFWVQIMILILVGRLQTLRVEFGLGEVCLVILTPRIRDSCCSYCS